MVNTSTDLAEVIDTVVPTFIGLRDYLNAHVLEHEYTNEGMLLAAISRQHHCVLSDPGEAKSHTLDLFSGAIQGANHFFKQLGPRITWTSMTGMPSIRELTQHDDYKYRTDKRMWNAHFVMLDEWNRCSDAFRDECLTWMVQRHAENGGVNVHTPLICVYGASNSLPEPRDAMYDRFLFRYDLKSLSRGGRVQLLSNLFGSVRVALPPPPEISLTQLEVLQQARECILLPDHVIHAMTVIFDELQKLGVFLSSRRLRGAAEALQAFALLSGRAQVLEDDLDILSAICWNRPEEQTLVAQVLGRYAQGFVTQARALADEAAQIFGEAEKGAAEKQKDVQAMGKIVVEAAKKIAALMLQIEEKLAQATALGRDVTKIQAELTKVQGYHKSIAMKMVR